MTDIKFNRNPDGLELAIENSDIATDSGLEMAVLLSLFTDARVDDDDLLPAGETERRGWWGDEFTGDPADHYGSLLWTLDRSTPGADIANLAKGYAEDSLQWMIDEGAAKSIEVETQVLRGQLLISVDLFRPNDNQTKFRYNLNWKALENGV